VEPHQRLAAPGHGARLAKTARDYARGAKAPATSKRSNVYADGRTNSGRSIKSRQIFHSLAKLREYALAKRQAHCEESPSDSEHQNPVHRDIHLRYSCSEND
jgi:hypothetical protein